MNLVNGHGRVQRVGGGALFKKVSVAPGVVEIPNHGRCPRRLLGKERHGVRLLRLVTELGGVYVELIQRGLADAWDKAFPDSRRASSLELMGL